MSVKEAVRPVGGSLSQREKPGEHGSGASPLLASTVLMMGGHRDAVRNCQRKGGFLFPPNLTMGPRSPVRAGTRSWARWLSSAQYKVELGSDSQDRQTPAGGKKAAKSGVLIRTNAKCLGAFFFQNQYRPSELCTWGQPMRSSFFIGFTQFELLDEKLLR